MEGLFVLWITPTLEALWGITPGSSTPRSMAQSSARGSVTQVAGKLLGQASSSLPERRSYVNQTLHLASLDLWGSLGAERLSPGLPIRLTKASRSATWLRKTCKTSRKNLPTTTGQVIVKCLGGHDSTKIESTEHGLANITTGWRLKPFPKM